MHECFTGMHKYTATVLLQSRHVDVSVKRTVRTVIFSHGLRCTRRLRDRRAISWMTSSLCGPPRQCIWSPSMERLTSSSSSHGSALTPRQHPITSHRMQCIGPPTITAANPPSSSDSTLTAQREITVIIGNRPENRKRTPQTGSASELWLVRPASE